MISPSVETICGNETQRAAIKENLHYPYGIATDVGGNILVTDKTRVLKIFKNGRIDVILPKSGYPTSRVPFEPIGITVSPSGLIYVSDCSNHKILQIRETGTTYTIEGVYGGEGGYKDGPTNVARFKYPKGLASDQYGNIYVADFSNKAIRKIDILGRTVSTVVKVPQGVEFIPDAIAVDGSGNIFVADLMYNCIHMVRAGPSPVLEFFSDGKQQNSTQKKFKNPSGIAVKGSDVFVADRRNHCIRKISNGHISIVAENLKEPVAVTIDSDNNILFVDNVDHRVGRINFYPSTQYFGNNAKSTLPDLISTTTPQNPQFTSVTPLKSTYTYPYLTQQTYHSQQPYYPHQPYEIHNKPLPPPHQPYDTHNKPLPPPHQPYEIHNKSLPPPHQPYDTHNKPRPPPPQSYQSNPYYHFPHPYNVPPPYQSYQSTPYYHFPYQPYNVPPPPHQPIPPPPHQPESQPLPPHQPKPLPPHQPESQPLPPHQPEFQPLPPHQPNSQPPHQLEFQPLPPHEYKPRDGSPPLQMKKIISRCCEHSETIALIPLSRYVLLSEGESPSENFKSSFSIAYGKENFERAQKEFREFYVYGKIQYHNLKQQGTTLTKYEYLAVYYYTCEWKEKCFNTYSLLNTALNDPNRDVVLLPWRFYLHFFFGGLRKCPKFTKHQDVYRGVNRDLVLEFNQKYVVGNTIVWHSCTSTTTQLSKIEYFMTKGNNNGEKTTIFTINQPSGFVINHLSSVDESEVLLPPGSTFRIVCILSQPTSNIIQIEQIETIEEDLRL